MDPIRTALSAGAIIGVRRTAALLGEYSGPSALATGVGETRLALSRNGLAKRQEIWDMPGTVLASQVGASHTHTCGGKHGFASYGG